MRFVQVITERLRAELSVVWLLCLGVLLVVLSSAVLAATQWTRINPVGQYLLLLSYTTLFWLGGRWAAGQPRLQVTAKTLGVVALLLVPIHGWALHGLQVWQFPLGIGMTVVALVGLTAVAIYSDPLGQGRSRPRASRAIVVGLLYLHFGWGAPLAAVYGGVIAVAIAVGWSLMGDRSSQPSDAASQWLLGFYGLGIVLLRGFNTPGILPEQLGLAVGLGGALLASNARLRSPLPEFSELWIWLGRGLLFIGWCLTVATTPGQALVITLLGLGLRVVEVTKTWRSLDWAACLGMGVQAVWLAWRSLPELQQRALLDLALQITGPDTPPLSLLGVAYAPCVVVMVALADRLRRRWSKPQLATLTESISVAFSLLLLVFALQDLTVLSIYLVLATMVLAVVTVRRSPSPEPLIHITHGVAYLALLTIVADRWPDLSSQQGLILGSSLAVLEWGASSVPIGGDRGEPWRRSAWYFGCGVAGLTYFGLLGSLLSRQIPLEWGLLGLVFPVVLFLLAPASDDQAERDPIGVLFLGLTVPLTLALPWTRLLGLGLGFGLSGLWSRRCLPRETAWFTVILGLAWGASLLQDSSPDIPRFTGVQWYPILAIASFGLWLTRSRVLQGARSQRPADSHPASSPPPRRLADHYAIALSGCGYGLCIGLLLCLTGEVSLLYAQQRSPEIAYMFAAAIAIAALLYRQWRAPQNGGILLMGWATELIVAEGLWATGGDRLTLAGGLVALGFVTLAIAAAWQARSAHRLRSLDLLPLIYGGQALLLRSDAFTATTGWITLGVALIVLEVGRRAQSQSLGAIALLGMSAAWYELVLYQLLQVPGGNAGDGLVALAGVAVLIMGVYRGFGTAIQQRLRYPQLSLHVAAHLHWIVGCVLMLLTVPLAFLSALSMPAVALGVAALLTLYPLLEGRVPQPTLWLYWGFGQLVGWALYLRLLVPELEGFDPWIGVLVTVVAVLIERQPWQAWGWPAAPWRQFALVLPIAVSLAGARFLNGVNFWAAAGFYAILSRQRRRFRLSYLSVLLVEWAIARWLIDSQNPEEFFYALLLGGAVLYFAQIDPIFQNGARRSLRHWLRVGGLGFILLYGVMVSPGSGLLVGFLSLAAVGAGLGLQVRAFLFVGTALLILNLTDQFVLLNATFPFVKWVLGIVAGVALIWIAADFERRREQWIAIAQTWRSTLDEWE